MDCRDRERELEVIATDKQSRAEASEIIVQMLKDRYPSSEILGVELIGGRKEGATRVAEGRMRMAEKEGSARPASMPLKITYHQGTNTFVISSYNTATSSWRDIILEEGPVDSPEIPHVRGSDILDHRSKLREAVLWYSTTT